jgi:hypothetical protein
MAAPCLSTCRSLTDDCLASKCTRIASDATCCACKTTSTSCLTDPKSCPKKVFCFFSSPHGCLFWFCFFQGTHHDDAKNKTFGSLVKANADTGPVFTNKRDVGLRLELGEPVTKKLFEFLALSHLLKVLVPTL